MNHGITLCNLFEMAKREECRGRRPDIVYVFGINDGEDLKTVFYDDEENIHYTVAYFRDEARLNLFLEALTSCKYELPEDRKNAKN